MPRNTGELWSEQLRPIVVVTGKALMWGSIGVATLDVLSLLVDVLGS